MATKCASSATVGVGTLTARIFHGSPQNVLPTLCSLRCVNLRHSSQQWNVVFCPCYLADSFIQLLPRRIRGESERFYHGYALRVAVSGRWKEDGYAINLRRIWWTLYVFQNLDLGFVKYLLGRKAVKSVSEIILTSVVQSVAQQ